MGGSFAARWIHGSADCASNTDPPLQVHSFDESTFILRENKCLNYEGNFIYLLFGKRKALLLDTGSAPPQSVTLPLRKVVDKLITKRAAATHTPPVELVVAHTHGHLDHIFADYQFVERPGTIVIEPGVAAVREFFKLKGWPDCRSTFDLGGHMLSIIPTPGHEESHIAIYDKRTRIMFTGDMLYAGLLTVEDWHAFRESARRLARFAESHAVSYVLGCHIEMKREPRQLYPIGTTYQPEEHVLQLGARAIFQLRDACEAMGDDAREDVHDEFIIHLKEGALLS
ncbi:MAG: MBL fold metallo-hydrolase [Pyrinomonadaceae bacterium]|nr:MBL fold metallo-hydrolase [Pyrinomonadaceae bacterium]